MGRWREGRGRTALTAPWPGERGSGCGARRPGLPWPGVSLRTEPRIRSVRRLGRLPRMAWLSRLAELPRLNWLAELPRLTWRAELPRLAELARPHLRRGSLTWDTLN